MTANARVLRVSLVEGLACACCSLRVVVALLLAAATHATWADDGLPGRSERQQPVVHGEARGYVEVRGRERQEPSADEKLDRHVRVLRKGNSTRSSRKSAVAALPLEKLNDADRRQAEEVIEATALFRELPTLQCDVEPPVYQFFTQHPDVAVSIWRAMKISTFQMTATGLGSYDVDSGDGTTASVKVLHQSDEESLVLCHGLFKNPLLPKPIKATGLLHLVTELSRREDGSALATHRGRMFVAFGSNTVGTVAKVIAPVSHIIVDRNFREVSLFLYMMSVAMQRQPGWIEHMAARLDGVPDVSKTGLLKLTARVYVEARKRALAADGGAGEKIDVEQVLPPIAREPDSQSPVPSPVPVGPRVGSKPLPMSN